MYHNGDEEIELTNWTLVKDDWYRLDVKNNDTSNAIAIITTIYDPSIVHNNERYLGSIDMAYPLKWRDKDPVLMNFENFYYSQNLDILIIEIDIELNRLGYKLNSVGYWYS